MTTVYSGSRQIPGDTDTLPPAPGGAITGSTLNQAPVVDPNAVPSTVPAPAVTGLPPAQTISSSLPTGVGTLFARKKELEKVGAEIGTVSGNVLKKQNEAVDLQTLINQALETEKAPYLQQGIELSAAHQKNLADTLALREADVKKKTAIDTLATDLYNQKLEDPWATKGLGTKLGAIASMALGAYAQGRYGVQNTAKDIIDASIRQDLDLQRYNLQKKKGDIDTATGLLANSLKLHDNMDQAHNTAYLAGLAFLQKHIDAVTQKYASPQAAAAAEKYKADMEEKAVGENIKHNLMLQQSQTQLQTAAAANQLTQQQSDLTHQNAQQVAETNNLGKLAVAEVNKEAKIKAAGIGPNLAATAATISAIDKFTARVKSPNGVTYSQAQSDLANIQDLASSIQGGKNETVRKIVSELTERQLPAAARAATPLMKDSTVGLLNQLRKHLTDTANIKTEEKGGDLSQDPIYQKYLQPSAEQ